MHAQKNCHGLSAHPLASTSNNHLIQKFGILSSLFQTHFHACDTLPQVFWCTLILWTTLLIKPNIDRNKQINYNMGKIRWVNAQNKNHKNIYTVKNISLPLIPPSWGSQWIQSTPSLPAWGTNTTLNILWQVDTITF